MAKMTTSEAVRVATKNAAKMPGKYSFKAAKTSGLYWVFKLENEADKYIVNTAGDGSCDCPFGVENGICKHQVFLADELAYDASLAQRAEEYEEARHELAL